MYFNKSMVFQPTIAAPHSLYLESSPCPLSCQTMVNISRPLVLGALAVPSSLAFVPGTPHQSAPRGGSRSSLQATRAGSGVSFKGSTRVAAFDAVNQATKDIDGAKPSIAFVSATVASDIEEVRKSFAEKLPEGTPVHGITSSGSILTSDGARQAAVGCLLLSADDGSFATSYDAEDGAKAAEALKAEMDDPQAIFMGATPGAEEGVLEALSETFPGVPVYGGTAADDELSGAWSVFSSDASSGTGVSLVGIGDAVKFGASMVGPYAPTEKTCRATKTEGRRVFEIDGEPAADWVREWLGDEVEDQYKEGGLILPQTAQRPIGIKQGKGLVKAVKSALPFLESAEDEYVTCHLAALGGEEKWVEFFTPIPEGSVLTVMDSADGPATGYASALSDAYDAAKAQGSLDGADPSAGLLVFCGGMAIAVGDQLDAGLTSEGFSSRVDGLPLMGMTCFGEQAHLPGSGANVQRNLSVGCALFG